MATVRAITICRELPLYAEEGEPFYLVGDGRIYLWTEGCGWLAAEELADASEGRMPVAAWMITIDDEPAPVKPRRIPWGAVLEWWPTAACLAFSAWILM